MLDPRIYRAGLVAVALAVIVFAFSFQDQPGAAPATLAPQAFNGPYAASQLRALATRYPDRQPGSPGDIGLASYVATAFGHDNGFTVSTDTFNARTAEGDRSLENVIATRAGLEDGTIVVIAHRDATASPATAELSGTAALLSLANVLAGETLHRTIVLASTSGSVGGAGAEELARELGPPTSIDAVIVLGDMAGTHVREPVVVPWSEGVGIAPMLLRNTVTAALHTQTTLKAGGTSLIGQFARLAFPLTLSDQGVFGARGIPSVLLSASGERAPATSEPVSEAQMNGLGRTVLETISALDSGPSIPAPSAYMLFDGKVIPPWAIRLFVLVLILPVLGAAIDGLARANRRGHSIPGAALSAFALAAPFTLVALAVIGAKLTGLLAIAPPDPVGPGAVPIHSGDVVLLAGLGCLLVAAFALAWWLARRATRGRGTARNGVGAQDDGHGGAAAVVPAIMCVVTIAIWVSNPLAAALLVPALHLWIWVVDPELRLHPVASIALLLAGLAPLAVVIFYYASSLGFGPAGLLWAGVLMVAGGHIGLVTVLEWSVALGCTVSVVAAALRVARAEGPESIPVTVRGPVTYAGPGSLGGTESALKGPIIRR